MEDQDKLFTAAKTASVSFKQVSGSVKVKALLKLARRLTNETAAIISANRLDLDRMDDQDPKKDRLMLNAARIAALADSLEAIARLDDPSGKTVFELTNPDGLHISRQTVPLGVIGVIYESRPNVTVDVAALCIRSGNCCILRGGSDALNTNRLLTSLIRSTLQEAGIDENVVQLFPPGRELIEQLLNAAKFVDMIIPRGSQQLINYVRENSKIPVIETGAGVCHTYVEKTALITPAVNIVVNAKVSRPSVCNALDTVLVDRQVAGKFLLELAPRMASFNVEIFADEEAYALLHETGYPQLQRATAADFGREFLDLKCSVKVVGGLEEALEHISSYSSKHSEAIVSEDAGITERFLNEVDAAAVYVNASTRFTDGNVFGLGAEIGISTQKLHARGPFALEKLVTEKWFIRGSGQVRE